MSRPADSTRDGLIEAAITVFSAKGFEGGSVREITRLAKANQAAINYHFGGKDGLYREVLKTSIQAFAGIGPLDADHLAAMDGPQAVGTFIRAQLKALNRRDQMGRFLRIFTWENLSRTPVFDQFLNTEKLPIVAAAEAIVRKFLPRDAGHADLSIALVWLMSQTEPFIRHERLERAPLNLKIDQDFIGQLGDRLTAMVVGGLEGFGRSHKASGLPASQAAPCA
jgi:AcrR family transcriptional regulator